jgi:hypothetical protein
MFQAMTLRALLRTRQLALRHDPDAADRHVREQARQLEPVFEALRQKDADTP